MSNYIHIHRQTSAQSIPHPYAQAISLSEASEILGLAGAEAHEVETTIARIIDKERRLMLAKHPGCWFYFFRQEGG